MCGASIKRLKLIETVRNSEWHRHKASETVWNILKHCVVQAYNFWSNLTQSETVRGAGIMLQTLTEAVWASVWYRHDSSETVWKIWNSAWHRHATSETYWNIPSPCMVAAYNFWNLLKQSETLRGTGMQHLKLTETLWNLPKHYDASYDAGLKQSETVWNLANSESFERWNWSHTILNYVWHESSNTSRPWGQTHLRFLPLEAHWNMLEVFHPADRG